MPPPVLSQVCWLRRGPQGLLPGPLYLPTSCELWETLPPSHAFCLYGRSLYPVILEKPKYDRRVTSSPHPHPTETLPILQYLQDAAEDELRRPSAIWNLSLWLLTSHHVAPVVRLGSLRRLSWPRQALIIFKDLALAGLRPIGNLAQCLVCPEDWPSFSECSFPVLYKVWLPWQLHALTGGLF